MMRRLVMTAVILLTFSLPTLAQITMPDVVTVSGKFPTDGLQRGKDTTLAVILDIKRGFHANANTPTADFPTTVKLDPSPGLKYGKAEYPDPTMRAFSFTTDKIPVYEGKVIVTIPVTVAKNAEPGDRVITGQLSYQSCDNTSCYPPVKTGFEINAVVVGAGAAVKTVNTGIFQGVDGQGKPTVDSKLVAADKATSKLIGNIKDRGLPFVFVAGLLLCFSPCVFPMVPVIVGYFGGQGQGKKAHVSVLALLFVIGLALTYSIIGTAAAFAGKGLGTVMQNPVVPLVVSGILVVLALSMFGLFEIPVPSFIASKSQARSGVFGALAMGLVFGLVAAPCVGPAVVALLMVVGQMGDPVKGFMMFFTLSLGLGTPFFFLALFSGSLAKIPKPGTWMMAVRKIFGFLLLGAALYYVKQLLPSLVAELLIPLYLIIAGVYWALFEGSTRGLKLVRPIQQTMGVAVVALGAWTMFIPTGQPIQWTPYTEQAAKMAVKAEKPVIIDFTAKWCKPCEELDKTTFSNAAVKKESARFTHLRVDMTKSSLIAENARKLYKVSGPPTILIIDSKGVEKDRVLGYIKPGPFLEKLKSVR